MTPKSIFAAVLVFLPAPALAQSIDAGGVWSGTPASEMHQVADDLVVIHLNVSHDRFEPVDAEHPAADASGQCFGSVLVRAGQPTGSGHCHYVSAEDEQLVTSWTLESIDQDGATSGRWEIVSGSGRWADASGSGTFRTTQGAEEGYRTELSGELTLN